MDSVVLQSEALLLPKHDRALLADRLLASLSVTPVEIEEAWTREVEGRLEAFRKGEMEAVDGPSAMADLRAKFAR